MYACSNAFHTAVAEGNQQIALLIFENAVFTHEDIDVETGIEFDDNFSTTGDFDIGQVPSSEIRFAVFNDDRLLNNFGFGEFTATIGVKIGESSYTPTGVARVTTGYATYYARTLSPYLYRGSNAVAEQPGFPVSSMLAYDGKVYVFSEDRRYAVYNDATGANITADNPISLFMRKKGAAWSGKGIYYDKNARILYISEHGTTERYEFVPLGVFEADRPNVPDQIRIEMTCFDRMQKFERDMPSAGELGLTGETTTIRQLLARMCSYVGVPLQSAAFPNEGATVRTDMSDFGSVTMRTVVGWIAEAAGSIARFNRDGMLIMDWVSEARHDTSAEYDENDYAEMEAYWYETHPMNRLCVRRTAEGEDRVRGNGVNGYLIQDNPLLDGATFSGGT